MALSLSQRRIERAEELAVQRPFAAELLEFYVRLVRFQDDLRRQIEIALPKPATLDTTLGEPELSELGARFASFLSMVEAHGPELSAAASREMLTCGPEFLRDLLSSSWREAGSRDAAGLLARAFLQPYAELLRARTPVRPLHVAYAVCSYCNRKPVVGVLRPKSEGAARWLVCSFCSHEWEFRRLVCPACGEENDRKLPVYTASDFDYIRVECCESCKMYLKTVDLTKNGLAEPVVDEIASVPVDMWARDHGYAKLQTNILGL
jgi:formate dehydrogenase maturation protein FdhE